MSEDTISVIQEFKWNVGDVLRGGYQDSRQDLFSDVKLRIVLDKQVSGHKCSECQDSMLYKGIYTNSSPEEYISLYVIIEPGKKSGDSFFYVYNKFRLTISISTYDNRISLCRNGKMCIPVDEKKTKFGFCYFMITDCFYSLLRTHDPATLIVICRIENMSADVSEILYPKTDNFIKSFQSLLNNETLSDVTLNVMDKFKIPAHKTILYARSPYFEKMFSHNNLENSTNEVRINFEYEPFCEVLKYIYTEKIEKVDTMGIEIFKIAHYYQIADLQSICENFLKSNLVERNNVIEILKLADDCELIDLKNYCIKFFVHNANTVENNKDSVTELLQARPNLGYELLLQLQSRLQEVDF